MVLSIDVGVSHFIVDQHVSQKLQWKLTYLHWFYMQLSMINADCYR